MRSIWTETARLPAFDPLHGDARTDVLIIGGGMAGLLLAHRLTAEGIGCLLVEAGAICSGVTANTTAKVTAQHGLIYDRLIRTFGAERAGQYLTANLEAVAAWRTMCRGIDCAFEDTDAFVYTRSDPSALTREQAALRRLGYDTEITSAPPLPIETRGAIRFGGQAQVHPLQLAAAIAPGLNIREHTRVTALAPGRAVTERGVIHAEQIVVCTHFPFVNRHGGYFLRLYQHRSHVLALKEAPLPSGMYLDAREQGLSFRRYRDVLLLGGGSHRTGKHGGGWPELEAFARQHLPGAQIVGRWAAQDCMSLDGVPYIGDYAKAMPGMYVATGFNKWGMTSAMAAAAILTDALKGRRHPCADVFSPARSSLTPQLFLNITSSMIGMLTPTVPRCPHMGCALKYNRAEHSWDCPCHGTRLDSSGRVLDNPANRGKRM